MQPEPITQTSAGMETPSETVARVKQSIKPIKADVLGNTPAFVPPPKQNSQGALNRLEASVTPAPQVTETPAPVAPVAEPNLRDSLVQRQLAALEQLGTKGAKTQQIMEEQKVLEKQQALDAIDKEIAGRENYYTRRLETLQDKGGGLKIGYESEANTIRRDRARELADLQIVRAGKSQDVETARQYANDLIAAEFEPLKDELKYTNDLYDMLANDLTESEILQVQDQMQTKRDATELAQSTSQAIYSELINAGAYTPEKGRLLQEAMAEASQAIKDGQSPDAAIAKMQSAMTGVQTMAQQQFQDQMLTSQASRSASYASRRSSLISAAEKGDPQAIAELGFNPSTSSSVGAYSTIVDTASLLVGAERGKETRRAMAQAIEQGNYPVAYSMIANNVQSSLQGESASRFGSARSDIQVLSGLRSALEQFEAAGGDMGFFKGTADQIARKFGQLKTDPAFASLAVQLEREFQAYRQAMTGAAFSPGESADYEKVNPSANKNLDLNFVTIDGAINQLTNRVAGTVEAYVPGSRELYDLATGKEQVVQTNDPSKEPVGAVIEMGGVRYRKVGDNQYEEIT